MQPGLQTTDTIVDRGNERPKQGVVHVTMPEEESFDADIADALDAMEQLARAPQTRADEGDDAIPEGVETVTGGTVFNLEIEASEPAKSMDVAMELATKITGKVITVEGTAKGVKMTVWTNDTTLENDLRIEERRMGSDGTASLTIAKSTRPLIVGKIGNNLVVLPRAGKNARATTPVEFQGRTTSAAPRPMLSGERDKSEAAIVAVTYKNPAALDAITAEAGKMGAVITAPTAGNVTLVVHGEKALAGAAELAQRITKKVEGTRAGITAGIVHVGYIGGQMIVTGEALAVVKKLQNGLKRAGNERLLMDEASATYAANDERLSGEVTLTLGDAVSGLVAISNVERAEPSFTTTRLVGRDGEMTRIETLLASINEGDNDGWTPNTQAVVGGPGIGKTKLLLTVKEQAEQKPETTTLYVTATPTHTLENGWFAGQLVQKIQNAMLKPPADEITSPGEASFWDGSSDKPNVEKLLAGQPCDEATLADEIGTMIHLLRDNKIFILDNLEAIDEMSARVIAAIMRKGKEGIPNTVFVLAGRSGGGEELPQALGSVFNGRDKIELQPLQLKDGETPNETCRTFVSDALGVTAPDTVEEKVLTWVAEKSGGNPLRMVELCRTLREVGAVQRLRTGNWTFRTEKMGDIVAIAEPTGKSIISARLERILGRSTEMQKTMAMIIALGNIPTQLMDGLITEHVLDNDTVSRLIKSGILTRTPEGYEVAHPLMIDEGKRVLPEKLQQAASAQLANLIQKWDGDGTLAEKGIDPSQKEIMLFTFARDGGLAQVAITHALGATQKLAGAYASREAAQTAKAALHLMTETKEGSRTAKAELVLLLGEAQMRSGQHTDAEKTLERVWTAIKDMTQTNGTSIRLGRRAIELLCNNAYISNRIEQLRRFTGEWTAFLGKTGGESSREAVDLFMGCTLFREGKNKQALPILQRLAEEATDAAVKAEAQRMCGMAGYNAILFGEVPDQEVTVQAIQADPALMAQFEASGAQLAAFTEPVLNGQAIAPDRTRLPSTLARQAFVLMVGGKLDEAQKIAEQGCRAAATSGLPLLTAKAYGMLGEILLKQGKTDEAVRAFRTAQSDAAVTRDAAAEYPISCYNLGAALLEKDDIAGATAQAMESIRGFAVEFCKGEEEENLPAAAQTIKKAGANASTETVDAAITALLEDKKFTETFPNSDTVFLPLVVVGKCVARGATTVPPYVRTLAIRGGIRVTGAMGRAALSETLSAEAQGACTKGFTEKATVLDQLAA